MSRLKLFGGTILEVESGPITGRAVQRHRIALLALLSTTRRAYRSRDQLVTLLWPSADAERGRKLLSDSIYRINQALGGDAVVGPGEDVRLNRHQITTDIAVFEAAVDERNWRQAAEIYTGPFLDGFYLPDASDFDQWMESERRHYARLAAKAIEALAAEASEAAQYTDAVDWWQRLAAIAPDDSRVAMEVMRALEIAGNRAGALRHARVHSTLLRESFGMEPDRAVQTLADQIAARNESAIVAHRSSSVAVLPFLNLSVDPEYDYFADGITEDVIAHLSKIRALKVISRTSVMPFKDRQLSVREIGTTLGASTLLDGSVRHAADRVRIVAKLIDVESEQHLWVETYDRQLTDIFAIQTDVALRIAAALKAELSRDEQTRIRREPTKNLQAYQLYQLGRQSFIGYTPDSLTRAIECFERATERDPTFALAFANLAMALIELAEIGVAAPGAAYERAANAAARALRLDPELGAAHTTMGYLKAVREFDWTGAECAFERALVLSPSGADAYDLYGRMCAALGRYDEALALQRRARELDPLAHRMDGVTTLLRAGRYDQAVIGAEEATELDPGHDRARATLGWAYFFSGRRDDGLAELERAVAASRGNTLWLGQLGEAYGMAGNLVKAKEILRELEQRSETAYVSPYHFAYVYTGLGDVDRAMDWLERAVADRTGPAYGIKGSFLLAPLRTHPRFRALLREMKLE
ncbi:MAG: tetratricopeptide repeat protein [bacterium]